MPESTQATSEATEYSEVFIGECITGSCDRPATVRVYEDFVLCALHHAHYEAGHDADEAGLALDLMAGWRSVAAMHGNGYLLELFEYAKGELLERKGAADRRLEQLKRIDLENVGNTEIRVEMGRQAGKKPEQEEAGAMPKLSAFGRQLVALTGYMGEDLTRLATDMVWMAGHSKRTDVADAGELVEALEARMRSASAGAGGVLPEGFVADLAEGLRLPGPERDALARAYAYDEDHQPAEGRSVLTEINHHMSQAAVLLQESHPIDEDEDEAWREARHALAGAGLIVAKLLRGRRSEGSRTALGEEGGEPESGGASEDGEAADA